MLYAYFFTIKHTHIRSGAVVGTHSGVVHAKNAIEAKKIIWERYGNDYACDLRLLDTTHRDTAIYLPSEVIDMETTEIVNDSCFVIEMCPHCDEEISLEWNIKEKGFQVFCPNCGKKMMLCDQCLHYTDNSNQKCDWQKSSCFRTKQRIEEQPDQTRGEYCE